jgi:hypothetical protein
MNGRQDPVLSQFAAPPNPGAAARDLVVDRVTGLLHEPGATVPFIEELIHMGCAWQCLLEAATILTEATDPPDPDLVRGDNAWSRLSGAVSTVLTKAEIDPADPDLIRLEPLQRVVGDMETLQTRQAPDPGDPGLVRAEHARKCPSYDE